MFESRLQVLKLAQRQRSKIANLLVGLGLQSLQLTLLAGRNHMSHVFLNQGHSPRVGFFPRCEVALTFNRSPRKRRQRRENFQGRAQFQLSQFVAGSRSRRIQHREDFLGFVTSRFECWRVMLFHGGSPPISQLK